MRRLLPLVLSLFVFGAAAPAAFAAEPPNQHDPCSRAGRDTCGTTGVGRYATYRYGLRWFGDYRKAVPGEDDPTFCIDLRFWYPSATFGYRARSTDGLKNREGKKVSVFRDPLTWLRALARLRLRRIDPMAEVERARLRQRAGG